MDELKEIDDTVPPDIITDVIQIQKRLFAQIKLHNPEATAYSFIYFKRTYKTDLPTPDFNIIRAITTLHLAAKVCEDNRPLLRYLDTFCKCLENENFRTNISRLGTIEEGDQDFKEKLKSKIIDDELDLITELQFNFKVELPYEHIKPLVKTLIHWHLPDTEPAFRHLYCEIGKRAFRILNDLQATYWFYVYEPKIVAQAAIGLAIVSCNLPLSGFDRKVSWNSLLLPKEDSGVMTAAFNNIGHAMKKYVSAKQAEGTPIDPEALRRWFIYPLEPPVGEPKCPPPPQDIILTMRGPTDGFCRNWLSRMPRVPPPPLDSIISALGLPEEPQPPRYVPPGRTPPAPVSVWQRPIPIFGTRPLGAPKENAEKSKEEERSERESKFKRNRGRENERVKDRRRRKYEYSSYSYSDCDSDNDSEVKGEKNRNRDRSHKLRHHHHKHRHHRTDKHNRGMEKRNDHVRVNLPGSNSQEPIVIRNIQRDNERPNFRGNQMDNQRGNPRDNPRDNQRGNQRDNQRVFSGGDGRGNQRDYDRFPRERSRDNFRAIDSPKVLDCRSQSTGKPRFEKNPEYQWRGPKHSIPTTPNGGPRSWYGTPSQDESK